MADDEYIRRAHEAVELAKRRLPEYRGDCSECRYSRDSLLNNLYCVHPAVQLVSFNETDAYHKRRIVDCSEQRDKHSMFGPVVCGPDGALFERRPSLLERMLLFFNQTESK